MMRELIVDHLSSASVFSAFRDKIDVVIPTSLNNNFLGNSYCVATSFRAVGNKYGPDGARDLQPPLNPQMLKQVAVRRRPHRE